MARSADEFHGSTLKVSLFEDSTGSTTVRLIRIIEVTVKNIGSKVSGMEWLNFHHLRYFWAVATEGSLRGAAERLNVSQPSICAQVQELEKAFGEELFRRSGRQLVLTDTGQMVFGYAEEIFSLGRELLSSVKQAPTTRGVRLAVGIVDSFAKLVSYRILRPLFENATPIHVTCREGKPDDLLAQLASHRLDIVLSDEPASSGLKVKTFNHLLGGCGVAFCAAPKLAAKMRQRFPKCLDQAPALLPTQNSNLRRALEQWFRVEKIQPKVIAEFEDPALAKVVAAEGWGFAVIPLAALDEAADRYGFRLLGSTNKCQEQFYAITAERRLTHPAVLLLTEKAKATLSSRTPRTGSQRLSRNSKSGK